MSLALTSFLGGALEAAFLVTVTRTALAVAADDDAVGLLGGREVSVGSAISAAGLALLVRMVLALVGVFASTSLSVQVSTVLRQQLSNAYLHASWSMQQGEASGQLQQLLSAFTNQVVLVVGALAGSGTASLNLAALIVVSLVVDPLATAVVFVALIALGSLLAPLRRRIRARSRTAAAAQMAFANAVSELGGLGLEMQTYGVRDQFGQRIDALTHREAAARRGSDLLRGALVPVYTSLAFTALLGGLALAAVVGVGELSSVGAVMLVMLRSLTYGQQLQVSVGNLMASLPYLDTLDETVARYESNRATGGRVALNSLGVIDVGHVSFAYGVGRDVLHDLTFRVEVGETVGVIGPSGGGKSTLVQLLLGVRDPTVGTITVGGVDLREIDRNSWATKVAFVAQDALLFSGTVAENVAFFRTGIDARQVASAVERANLLPDLAGMPDGLQTDVGERGSRLSGGQRQRVSIARALAGEPQLLILDEPTSALDVKSESLIRETLLALKGSVTVIVIAHRLSTLESCDRIMVIQDGRLRAMGTPADLADQNKFYREALVLSGMA